MSQCSDPKTCPQCSRIDLPGPLEVTITGAPPLPDRPAINLLDLIFGIRTRPRLLFPHRLQQLTVPTARQRRGGKRSQALARRNGNNEHNRQARFVRRGNEVTVYL